MQEPVPLDYSHLTPANSNWPLRLYALALIWAVVSLRWYTAVTTSYREDSLAELRAQLPLILGAALRLAWARYRREQSKGWIFYVALLLLAPVIWALISAPLASLGRSLWGGPLIP